MWERTDGSPRRGDIPAMWHRFYALADRIDAAATEKMIPATLKQREPVVTLTLIALTCELYDCSFRGWVLRLYVLKSLPL